jgi:hypothetical protein
MFNNPNQYQHKIEQLNLMLAQNAQELLNEFGIPFRHIGHYLSFSCPIHSSRKSRSASMVIDEDSPYYGTYRCWSGNCNKEYGSKILGFIHGVLSAQQGKKILKKEVVQWSLKFLGLKSLQDIPSLSRSELKKNKYYELQIISTLI